MRIEKATTKNTTAIIKFIDQWRQANDYTAQSFCDRRAHKALQAAITNPFQNLIVARSDRGRIVGVALPGIQVDLLGPDVSAVMYFILAVDGMMGAKATILLWETSKQWAKASGATRFVLDSTNKNATTQKLFTKLAGEPIGQVHLYEFC